MRFQLLVSSVLLLALITPTGARSQWQFNGVPLSSAPDHKYQPDITVDGAGGTIVTWYDYRNGTADIYVQRFDASGLPQWTIDGVALCTAAGNQFGPRIVPDGSGGAIVTWYDARGLVNYDIYAQGVNASGAVQWTANGVALSTAANDQQDPRIASDSAGGAIVVWTDYRPGSTSDIYARRVNAAGTVQWTANGAAVCTLADYQTGAGIVSDGSGGAIFTWSDRRSTTNYDTYVQRMNSSGTAQWTANGVALCTAADNQLEPTIVADGSGGAIVTWQDYRNALDYDLYSRRVNSAGVPQWTANGVMICGATNTQQYPVSVSDGLGGAIVAWRDFRTGTTDIYARRINSSGVPQWTADGVALCTATNGQQNPVIAADGVGGAVVAWDDYRSAAHYDVYAQRVDGAGAVFWNGNGVAVGTGLGNQRTPVITADGTDAMVIAWQDDRNGATQVVYGQRVEYRHGAWGHPEPAIVSATDIPSDQGGKVAVNWRASGHDILNLYAISHYSVWRAIDAAAAVSMNRVSGEGRAWADPSLIGPDFHGMAIAHESTASADYYWEWVANQDATQNGSYSYSASTRADSVGGNAALHYFQVIAHTDYQYVLYKSNTMSGYSVDDLAPAAPLLLTAQRVGPDVLLKWNRVRVPDLRDYAVYRATSSGVTPVPVFFLSSAADSVHVDPNAPGGTLYYIVTAQDVHENQSAPSNEASVSGSTGVGNTPPIKALTVLQNYPNPFTRATELTIGLPNAASIAIEVYDVAGRRVRSLSVGDVGAGWQHVPFSALDENGGPMASGVYFYRVTANGETVTRKMVIAR